MVGEMERQLLSPRQPIALIAMSTVSQSIPVEFLWESYDYNPITGQLWSKRYSKPLKGAKKIGALRVRLNWNDNITFTNYGRVVYAWCTGTWPANDVDHRNRNWADNRIQNLRAVDRRTNNQNKANYMGGAHFNKKAQKWRAKIVIGKKAIHLGTFPSKAEAQAAYQTALNALS